MPETEAYESFPPLGDDQVTERLINLVMLLTSSRFGFTKSEIAEKVPGYSINQAAMERMFERDKRILAVNNIILSEPLEEDEYRYKISLESAALPELNFTSKEQEILRLATLAWENTTQKADAILLQTKLEAIGFSAPDVSSVSKFEIPLNLESVFSALTQKRVLNFQYRRPGQSDTTKRELEIWGVALRSGSWFIYGKDRLRNDLRVFNLFRVVGGFTISGEGNAYEAGQVDLNQILDPSNRDDFSQVVKIKVSSGKGEYWRNLADDKDSLDLEKTLRVTLLNPSDQLPRLAQDSPHVVVIEPAEVVDYVAKLVWGNSE